MSARAPSNALIDALQEQHIYYELIPHRRTQSAAPCRRLDARLAQRAAHAVQHVG